MRIPGITCDCYVQEDAEIHFVFFMLNNCGCLSNLVSDVDKLSRRNSAH